MDKLLKGAVDSVPAAKELIEVQEALPLPEPVTTESSVSWVTGIGIAAIVAILAAAFVKYKCKCKK